MKIKPEHFERLRKLVAPVLADITLVERYETGQFARADKVKDLQMRFCFDVLWVSDITVRGPLMREVYEYMHDDHLYTALKRLCPTVVRRY